MTQDVGSCRWLLWPGGGRFKIEEGCLQRQIESGQTHRQRMQLRGIAIAAESEDKRLEAQTGGKGPAGVTVSKNQQAWAVFLVLRTAAFI